MTFSNYTVEGIGCLKVEWDEAEKRAINVVVGLKWGW
jgi:hypothetical protein